MNYPSIQYFNTRKQAENRKATLTKEGFKVGEVKVQYNAKGIRPRINGFYIEYNW